LSVEFTLRFEAGAEEAWENSAGINHGFILEPRLGLSLTNTPPRAVDGIMLAAGQIDTELPVEAIAIRIDNGAWEALPAASLSPSWQKVIETKTLARGTHVLTAQVKAGPYTRETHTSFEVARALSWVSSTALPAPPTVWDFAQSPNGRLFLARDDGMVEVVQGAAVPLESAGVLSYFIDVEATSGSVYGLAALSLVKWTSQGRLDAQFGNAGVIDLSAQTFDGTAVCWASHVAANDDFIFITDSCNARLLRLSPQGTFIDAITLATDGATILEPVLSGAQVWVLRSSMVNALVRVSAGRGHAMRSVETVSIDSQTVWMPQGYAVTPHAIWVTTGDNLYRLDRQGHLTATWLGANLMGGVDGALSIGRTVQVLPDESVRVLSVQTGKLERFVFAPAP
jgi:hypothetical protein